jgi:chemotaxis protein methyltransferase CheR
MSHAVSSPQVERFRTLVAQRIGLNIEDTGSTGLADTLRRRASARHTSPDAYLDELASSATGPEFAALAQELTVGETYFFRHRDQFRALVEAVLPQRLQVAEDERRGLRILSAACASGEEAYSIAMTLADVRTDPAHPSFIRAVDMNPAVLEKARRARYGAWALRDTPPAMKQRWFRADGDGFLLDAGIRRAVLFEQRNLAADDPQLWQPGFYDVVFCRNALMYFTSSQARAAIARIERALAPGGFLFLGHAETLRGLSQDFHLCHTHDTFYYRQRTGDDAVQGPLAPIGTRVEGPALVDAVHDSRHWIDAIGKASQRIRTLTDRPLERSAAAPQPGWGLDAALALFRDERFSEALKLVQALPADASRHPDALLLEAVLLAHSGRLDDAEDTCHRLLAIDEFNAGAHYVLALCREGRGDSPGAKDRDQVAAYLDPAFAMPRVHLGLLARRAGDREGVRSEFGQAIALLEREDPSRLLLFGGGFGRDALLALCRAELHASGGAR